MTNLTKLILIWIGPWVGINFLKVSTGK